MAQEDTFVVVAGKPTIEKDPNAVKDYYINLTSWLQRHDNDTIAEILDVLEDGVVCDSSAIVASGLKIQLWVSGGVAGTKGSLTVRFRTVGLRIDDRTVYFKLKPQ
jgi:hypothetical protein